MTKADPGPRREDDEPRDSDSEDSESSNDLIGNILRAAENAVAAPIQQLAPDHHEQETYSIASRRRSALSLRKKTIPVEDQRHPGKPGLKISRNTRNIDEVLEWETERAANKEAGLIGDSTNIAQDEDDESQYPGPLALGILLISICLEVFLVSLDRTIITTVCVSCRLITLQHG